jgi:homoserine dehydrogenase
VVGDLIEVFRRIGSSPQPASAQAEVETKNGTPLKVRPIGDLQVRYFIRLEVADTPGVLAQIAQVLGDGQISIAAVLQRDTNPETESAEIVITTHPAKESSIQKALEIMAGLPHVRRVGNTIRIEE